MSGKNRYGGGRLSTGTQSGLGFKPERKNGNSQAGPGDDVPLARGGDLGVRSNVLDPRGQSLVAAGILPLSRM